MTTPLSSHTVQDVYDFVTTQFGDIAGVQIDETNIIRWVNMGQMEMVTKLKNIQAINVTNTVINQAAYDVPSDLIKLESVDVDGTLLTPTTREEAQRLYGSNTSITYDSPQYVWVWADKIYFYPVPNAVKTLTIYYIARPANVSTLGSLLGIPDIHYNALLDYCMSKASELDENAQGAQIFKSNFEKAVQETLGVDRSTQGAFSVITEVEYD